MAPATYGKFRADSGFHESRAPARPQAGRRATPRANALKGKGSDVGTGGRDGARRRVFRCRACRDGPGGERRHTGRARPRAGPDRADRLGERGLGRRAGGPGLGDDQQVRRGLPGPALLRRLRVHGRGRGSGARAGEEAVRLRLRQRPAPFRRPGQSRCVLRPGQAGRHDPRHVARRRRAPDPRRGAQLFGQVVPCRAVRRAARGCAHRLRRGRATRRRA